MFFFSCGFNPLTIKDTIYNDLSVSTMYTVKRVIGKVTLNLCINDKNTSKIKVDCLTHIV